MINKQPVYIRLCELVMAIQNCQRPEFNGHPDYPAKHIEALERIAREYLPRGSGFDMGSTVDIDASGAHRLCIDTAFHHMDEHGFYCGWTDHRVTVRAHLAWGFTVHVSGVNKRGIKDYIADTFHSALSGLSEL